MMRMIRGCCCGKGDAGGGKGSRLLGSEPE